MRFAGQTRSPRRAGVLWLSVPTWLLLAYFSKQNVALLGLLPCVMIASLTRPPRRGALRAFVGGGFLAGVSLFTLALLGGVSWQKFVFYFCQLPFQIGQGRIFAAQTLPKILAYHLTTDALVSPCLVFFAFAASAAYLPTIWQGRAHAAPRRVVWSGVNLLCAEVLLLTCVLFVVTTNNQAYNGFPYLFVSLGLTQNGVRLMFAAQRRAGARWLALFFLCFAGKDVDYFERRVNSTRGVHELQFDSAAAVTLRTPALQFMRFQMASYYYHFTAADLDATAAFLQARPGNFFLVGDCSILYGLTRRPSLLPSVWYHPGLTVPDVGTPEFLIYAQELLRNLQRARLQFVVWQETALNRIPLDQYPAVTAYLNEFAVTEYPFGGFTIFELRTP